MIWIILGSVVMFFASIVLAWIVIIKLPADYLVRKDTGVLVTLRHRPLLRWLLILMKNLLGMAFVVAGFIMLFTPGQGLMFMVIGLAMVDLPGKQKLLAKILQRDGIAKALNRIRANAGKPPLQMEHAQAEGTELGSEVTENETVGEAKSRTDRVVNE